ncbi:MAG: MATE family efflux transporter, partial [Oscillospiraceae bacterium]|nr:MATE family efflux transporter [Oscillospiraceae bacterium]
MERNYQVDPLRGSILKQMLLFALPIAGAALLQILFSCADTIVIGRFGHENAISAIGVSAAMINLLVGSLTALEAGVTVVAGNLYGKGETGEVGELLHTLPLTALSLGIPLTLLVLALSGPILRLLHCPPEFFADARAYFCIYFLGVPFMVVFHLLAAVLQAKGNSFVPFLFQIGASVVNIGLNLLFVIAFDWNVAGVAISTAFSQLLSALALTLYLTRQRDETRLDLRRLTAFRHTRPVFSIGVPSALEGGVLNLSGVIISAAINRFPSAVIAGNTVATTMEGLMCISFVGFANASVVFISQNYGSGNLKRVRQTYWTTMIAVFCGAELLGAAIYFLSPWLTALFTTDAAIIECARLRMFYMCLFFG